jgi:hypothetical protein
LKTTTKRPYYHTPPPSDPHAHPDLFMSKDLHVSSPDITAKRMVILTLRGIILIRPKGAMPIGAVK